MTDQGNYGKESISAFMDGESDELEVRRFLKESKQDDEIRAKWQRYHLVSASLKNELPPRLVDLSGNISDLLEKEAGHTASFSFRSIAKPISRFAVAASVTAIAVLGVQHYQKLGQDKIVPVASVDVVAEEQEPFTPSSPFSTLRVPLRTVSASSAIVDQSEPRPVIILQKVTPENQLDQKLIQSRLNELLLQHADNAALNTYQGMMPFARIPQTPKE